MPLWLRLIGPGVDAAKFIDVGVAQLRQGGGGGLTAIPAAAVDQDRGILLGNHLCGSRFVDGAHRQENGAGEVIPEKDSTVLVYCRSGNRSKTASAWLICW